jgi:hypothetical protein
MSAPSELIVFGTAPGIVEDSSDHGIKLSWSPFDAILAPSPLERESLPATPPPKY